MATTVRESEPLSAEELEELPVFPLPRVVFFPGTLLPLHLFEPRYRRMAEDCARGGPRAMAVALLAPGWENDYEGRPPIHTMAGAGRIVAHEQLDDGTHDILLQGVHRVQLDELAPGHRSYRRARASVVHDRGGASADEVQALWSCASAVATFVRREHAEFALGVVPTDGAARVADVVTDRLVAPPDVRQRILETVDVGHRVQLATEAVSKLLVSLQPGDQN
ncbi:MAG: LON peptidase substrate-binding domain-containing protein [Myxococcota bacterium]